MPEGFQTRSCHESISFNVGDETIRDRTGQPVVNCDESSHEQTMLNEVNMDFRIPGLPHSVVKHAQSSRVRELVQKIENHLEGFARQWALGDLSHRCCLGLVLGLRWEKESGTFGFWISLCCLSVGDRVAKSCGSSEICSRQRD